MEVVFGHVIPLESEGFKNFDTTTFSKLVSDINMLLKFIHQLLDVVSSNICNETVINNRKS